jgi:hypothetical protein
MARDFKRIVKDTEDRWGRFFDALLGQPRTINTEPPHYPEWADRKDRLDHAWINLFTEGFRDLLDRPDGDELSQRLGQVTGIATLLAVVGVFGWSIFSTLS